MAIHANEFEARSPYTQARIAREYEERRLKNRLRSLRWKIELALFTGYIPGTIGSRKRKPFSNQSQPACNWPLRIWLRMNVERLIRWE